jgi:hypothetical protein
MAQKAGKNPAVDEALGAISAIIEPHDLWTVDADYTSQVEKLLAALSKLESIQHPVPFAPVDSEVRLRDVCGAQSADTASTRWSSRILRETGGCAPSRTLHRPQFSHILFRTPPSSNSPLRSPPGPLAAPVVGARDAPRGMAPQPPGLHVG